jgi:exosortase K
MLNIKRNDIILYFVAILVCAVSYIILNKNIEISLFPHKTAIQYLFGFNFFFTEDVGYEQSNGLFIIARNCSGIKLFINLFLISVFGFLHRQTGLKRKITTAAKYYFISLGLALIITIIRIAVSIPFCTWERFHLIHNILSLAIYFMSGLILYYFMERKALQFTASRKL